jgi:hypothetical protein
MSKKIAGLLAVTVIAGAAVLAAPAPAKAVVYYPWCAYFTERGGGSSTCSFDTWAQCRATISGIGGNCYQNPDTPPSGVLRAKIHKRHRKEM